MPHNYQLTLINPDTGDQATVSGEFNTKAWDLLERYAEYSTDLANTKFIRERMIGSATIQWTTDSGLTSKSQLPPWDEVIVFLHKFRPVGLQNEATYFYNICNLLWRSVSHPYFQGIIRQQRALFSGDIMRSHFQLKSNDAILNSDKVLFAWLNAYENHRDQEKKIFVDSLHKLFPLDVSKVLFLHMLVDKEEAIYKIAELVRVVLGQQDSVELHGRYSRKSSRDQAP